MDALILGWRSFFASITKLNLPYNSVIKVIKGSNLDFRHQIANS